MNSKSMGHLTRRLELWVALIAFVFVVRSSALAAPATTQPAQQFMRFVDDGHDGGKLQTAVVSYKNHDGVQVDLVAAVHVGEASYYEGLNTAFEKYDALLYEMIKPKDTGAPVRGQHSGSMIGMFQRFLKDSLHLDYQLDDIDYSKANFVHADLDAETFTEREHARGESIFGIMLKSMMREWEKAASGEQPKQRPMDLIDLLMAMRAPDRPRQLKLLLARQFDSIEEQMAGLDGPDGSVIITERNAKCLEVLKKAMADGDKKIGIFYGGGHMHDMSKHLEEMGFNQTAVQWRDAWVMTAPTTQPANSQ